MTVVPSSHSTGVASGVEGLDDVEQTDVILPRLQIDHKKAVFRDNLSKREYPELHVIILGLIKQRIMWAADTDEGDKPLCKSPDHDHGFPAVSDDLPKDKRFPWHQSNFRPEDFPPNPEFNNLVTLPCAACIFKEWEKNNWKVPPCAEQHTYAVLYLTNPEDPQEDHSWSTALLTFQKTGIGPSKRYISSFVQASQPMFTVLTKVTLTPASRGTVDYAVPTFIKGTSTDKDYWTSYGDQYRSIRDIIRQPPRAQDEEDGVPSAPSSNVNAAPTAAPVPATPAAAPAAPAPPAAAPPTPAAPVAPPQAAPPAAAPEPPVATAPPAAPAAPVDDDLPF